MLADEQGVLITKDEAMAGGFGLGRRWNRLIGVGVVEDQYIEGEGAGDYSKKKKKKEQRLTVFSCQSTTVHNPPMTVFCPYFFFFFFLPVTTKPPRGRQLGGGAAHHKTPSCRKGNRHDTESDTEEYVLKSARLTLYI